MKFNTIVDSRALQQLGRPADCTQLSGQLVCRSVCQLVSHVFLVRPQNTCSVSVTCWSDNAGIIL